jgi:hypothetical protein
MGELALRPATTMLTETVTATNEYVAILAVCIFTFVVSSIHSFLSELLSLYPEIQDWHVSTVMQSKHLSQFITLQTHFSTMILIVLWYPEDQAMLSA